MKYNLINNKKVSLIKRERELKNLVSFYLFLVKNLKTNLRKLLISIVHAMQQQKQQ